MFVYSDRAFCNRVGDKVGKHKPLFAPECLVVSSSVHCGTKGKKKKKGIKGECQVSEQFSVHFHYHICG